MLKLNPKQKKELEKVAKKYNLKFIIAHGSYATGRERPGSDLDIAVLGDKPLGEKIFDVQNDLADILGDSDARELDLKTLHGVDPLFRYQVTRDGILLCGNATHYEEFKAYAFRDFMDSEDLRRLELKITRAKQEALTKQYAR